MKENSMTQFRPRPIRVFHSKQHAEPVVNQNHGGGSEQTESSTKVSLTPKKRTTGYTGISTESEIPKKSENYFIIGQEAPDLDDGVSPILFGAKSYSVIISDGLNIISRQDDISEVSLYNLFLETIVKDTGIKLVTYGGRRFFLPRLNLVGMREGLRGKALFDIGDKYNGYLNRYSDTYHLDLMELITGHGSIQAPTLIDAWRFVNGSDNDVAPVDMVFSLLRDWNGWRNN